MPGVELLGSMMRQINREKKKPLDILTFSTHESWQSFIAMTGHNFYHVPSPERKMWMVDYRPIPPNVRMIHGEPDNDQQFDLVLSQTSFQQFMVADNVSRIYGVPHVNVEHTLPLQAWSDDQLNQIVTSKKNSDCKKFVFITEFNRNKWGFNEDEAEVIFHGIDTNIFKGWTGKDERIICVANMYHERGDLLGWETFENVVIKNRMKCMLVGDNQGMSRRATCLRDLVTKLQESRVFFNTSLWSPIPISVLEAMAVGLPVITTENCDLPRVIQNGFNGFISNDEAFLKEKLEWCLHEDNFKEVRKMGQNARSTILKHFGLWRFIDSWNNVFEETVGLRKRR